MKNYFNDRVDAALFVFDTIRNSKQGWPLTMTIQPERCEDCFVYTVTIGSSDDTDLQVAKFFSETQVNT